MNRTLLDLSGRIESFTIEILEAIANVSESLGVPFFVVGATARDIILRYGYDIKIERATQDIDLGVEVSGWDHYRQLREGLVATGKFGIDHKEAQRLLYQGSFRIDIIPFGRVADENHALSWPPDHEIEMSTPGFEEAYGHSIRVRLRSSPVLDVRCASLPGLALLKIISWHERYPERNKDAKDLALLMRTYLDAGNIERLLDEELDLVEKEDFDYVSASARLLGRDIAEILNPKIAKILFEILDRETGEQNRYRLVEDMMEFRADFRDNFQECLRLLEELMSGISERL